jgi:16S rRNA (guanine966-N2)-methyltransferase
MHKTIKNWGILMRIITGIARGRMIKAPEGMDTRPTSDRVKESLFNIISKKLRDSIVLDLFAGTGNLGLESISRGAEKCIFVENNKHAYKVLKENIDLLKFQDKSETYFQEAFTTLKTLHRINQKHDIIFLDPPYGKGLIESSIKEIYNLDLLNSGGIIVSEYDSEDNVPETIGKIKIYRTETYGRTKISFWTKEE